MIAHLDHTRNHPPHYLVDHVEEMLCHVKGLSLTDDIRILAEICVMIHDLGKKSISFQQYIQDPKDRRGSVKHAVGGAYALYKHSMDLSRAEQTLSYFAQLIVAAHHTYLKNYTGKPTDLVEPLPKELTGIEKIAEFEVKQALEKLSEFPIEEFVQEIERGEEGHIYFSTLIRFAMSAMIDADWLSTEAYFSEEKAAKRKYEKPPVELFQQVLEEFCGKHAFPDSTAQLNSIKKNLQLQAREVGKKKHSFFTLHAPTGTGKTIAALEFALAHAIKHNKQRIITALPLMNLTEETSALYKNIFGDDLVIEDHSTVFIEPNEEISGVRLAVNNWNRPFVVTTTNQLFESLFHNKPMKVRKLHSLYGSIIILDEYHKLPLHVLRPILKQLDILQKYFDVTVLMMSATPFALLESSVIQGFDLNIQPVELTNRNTLFKQIPKRVAYEWITEKETIISLAGKITKETIVLSIMNTRKEAQQLFLAIKEMDHSFERIYHLSTTMCSHHRKQILEDIQEDLEDERPIAVISTSVLEAGIDISFPVVYRMLAPIDAIVQAAGRCNRYGRLEIGRVILFELKARQSVSLAHEQGIGIARRMLENKGVAVLADVEVLTYHFKQSFSNDKYGLDKYEITSSKWLAFEYVARDFNIIEAEQIGVLCTTYKGFNQEWLSEKPTRAWWRKVQPYTVSLRATDSQKFIEKEGVRILKVSYDKELGVIL